MHQAEWMNSRGSTLPTIRCRLVVGLRKAWLRYGQVFYEIGRQRLLAKGLISEEDVVRFARIDNRLQQLPATQKHAHMQSEAWQSLLSEAERSSPAGVGHLFLKMRHRYEVRRLLTQVL